MKFSHKLLAIGGLLAIGAWVAYTAVTYHPSTNLRIGQATFQAKVASSEAQRRQGLSDSKPLRDNQAMLFVFPSDDKWGIWMKDMYYPIDIVWLDSAKVVRYIVRDARPDSYPAIFHPPDPMRYVVEMKSGTANHKRITIGTRAEFLTP